MSPQEEQQVIDLWNEFHSVAAVSDALHVPQTEVKDVLNQAKGQTLYLE
jgi:hypothetical protein